jgi:hypothetical protein
MHIQSLSVRSLNPNANPSNTRFSTTSYEVQEHILRCVMREVAVHFYQQLLAIINDDEHFLSVRQYHYPAYIRRVSRIFKVWALLLQNIHPDLIHALDLACI